MFVDFRKAYDSVSREGLFFKLISNGCSKNVCTLPLLRLLNYTTELLLSFKSHIGVKQGCNLSPTLFNIFVNDTPSFFTNSCFLVKLGETNLNCLLYADDLALLSESESGLQKCLTKLILYTKRWKLKINYKKSKRRTFLTSKWFFDNNVLEQVEDYTYLGINIHCSCSYKQILRVLHSKALRVYHGLFKSFSNIEKTPVKTLTKLFSSMVLPILLYNCEIWGPYLIGKTDSIDAFKNKIFKIYNDAEKLHLKSCKPILGVHLKSKNLAVYAELEECL